MAGCGRAAGGADAAGGAGDGLPASVGCTAGGLGPAVRIGRAEIAILAYSALFLAEDAGILRILADKGRAGVAVRIALGDPDGPNVAERGEEEGIGDAMAAKIRNALTLYQPLCTVKNIEIRLHRTVLYNSIYRADDQMLVNQHTYGIPATQAPVFCLCDTVGGEIATLYLDSFERVWARATQLPNHGRSSYDDS